MRAHRQKNRVEAALQLGLHHVCHRRVVEDAHAQVGDALHLGIQHVARQSVFWDAESHHAAGQRAGLVDGDLVAEPGQLVGGGQAGRTSTHDQHPLAGAGGRRRELPVFRNRLVAQETLHRIDAHRCVDLAPVADAFAAVVADAAHDRRKRVVLHQHAPGLLVVAALGLEQPGLDVLAGRALLVARRHAVEVDRPRVAPRAGMVGQRTAHIERDREGFLHGHGCVSSRP